MVVHINLCGLQSGVLVCLNVRDWQLQVLLKVQHLFFLGLAMCGGPVLVLVLMYDLSFWVPWGVAGHVVAMRGTFFLLCG